jgi:hypothetical protein
LLLSGRPGGGGIGVAWEVCGAGGNEEAQASCCYHATEPDEALGGALAVIIPASAPLKLGL